LEEDKKKRSTLFKMSKTKKSEALKQVYAHYKYEEMDIE
jgi:hypothetical protein